MSLGTHTRTEHQRVAKSVQTVPGLRMTVGYPYNLFSPFQGGVTMAIPFRLFVLFTFGSVFNVVLFCFHHENTPI